MLEHDDQWHFSHGLEIPQSVPRCCPGFTEREIRSQCSAWNFLVWVCLSLDTLTSAHWHSVNRFFNFFFFLFFLFLTQSKYCIAFSTFWFVLQYCHEWKGYVGCHFYCKCVKSGETVVCHTCRLHGPLLSMQLMGINRVDHFCQVCSKHKAFLPEVSVWSQAGAEMAN